MNDKTQTELRVYSSMDRLKHAFRSMAENAHIHNEKVRIIPNREIRTENLRIVFVVENGVSHRGYRPDKVFIDEMVSRETRHYLELVVDSKEEERGI